MYDLEKFKTEKYYIHTDTRVKFNKVLNWLDEQGLKWISGSSLLYNRDFYDTYESDTILSFYDGGVVFGDIDNECDNVELITNEPDYRKLLLEHMVESDFKFKIDNVKVYNGYLISYDEKEIIDLYNKYEELGYARRELVSEVKKLKEGANT